MTNQTRIVLDSADRPRAQAILDVTGIKTFSQLFSLFLFNYGDHLVNALKSTPGATSIIQPIQPGQEVIASDDDFTFTATDEDFRFDEPITGL